MNEETLIAFGFLEELTRLEDHLTEVRQ